MDAVTQMLPAFVFPDAPPKKIPNQTSRRLHSCASEFPPLFTLVLSLLSLHSFFEDYLMSQCNLLPSKVWSLMHDKCHVEIDTPSQGSTHVANPLMHFDRALTQTFYIVPGAHHTPWSTTQP